jgi:serine/threonine protein kinase/WD40 repeat protein
MAGPQVQLQLRGIFCEAVIRKTFREQAEYLDKACAAKPELRARVEALLRADREAGEFLKETPGASTEIEAELRLGQSIGPYSLLEEIGEGGFGLVFLAEQQYPVRRHVAIKVLKPGMDSRQVIARFEAERQALALMDHPNIARVLDAGATASGRPHFVMELARGVPLTDYCDRNGLTTDQRLKLFATVCDAVQHAHQKGIIHRDLKPSNLLVTQLDGVPVVKVIDFGIAKAIGQSLTNHTLHTGALQIMGTPLYMSPEQAELGGLDVDTRTDVYSLGVVLYELLTGTTPFDKQRMHDVSYDEMRRILREEDPPRPSKRLTTLCQKATVSTPRQSSPKQIRRFIRGELDWIVMKALEKDRARRYATASAFEADVQHYLRDEPVSACPPSAWYWFGKLARRNKGSLVAAGLVSLALVVGTAVSVWQAVRATLAMNSEQQALLDLAEEQKATQRELGRAQLAESTATRELERAQKAEEKATRELFDSLVAQARANRLSRRSGQRFVTLEILARATTMARQLQLPEERFFGLRNEAIAAMALPDVRVAKTWAAQSGGWAVFDPKHQRYARGDLNGTVFLRRAGDDAEICRLEGYSPGSLSYLFSPNTEYLAIADPILRCLHVWQLTGNAPTQILNKPTLGSCPQFSPDCRAIVAQMPDGTFSLFNLSTQDEVLHLPAKAPGCEIAFSPDGAHLALTGPGGTQVHEVESGKLLWQNQQAGQATPRWHPDNKTLAVYSGDSIFLWDLHGGKLVGKLDGLTGGGITFDFNPAGTLLLSRGWSGIVRLWDMRAYRQIFSVQANFHLPRFSPDGRFIASVEDGDHLGIWEVAAGDEYRSLTANPIYGKRPFTGLALNFDGRLVAGGGQGGCICVWDLNSGSELAFLEESPGYNLAAFEPRPARAYAGEKYEETLLTRGAKGLYRRSVQFTPSTGEVEIGTPRKLPVPGTASGFARSRDGKVLAASQGEGAVVWHPDEPGPLTQLGGQSDVRNVVVSPDGQWVLTGRYTQPGSIKIWRALGEKFEFDSYLPGTHTWASFSPDGKCVLSWGLDAGNKGDSRVIRRWEVGSWAEKPYPRPLPGNCPAFSADGKLVALETMFGIVRLIDAESGKEYARFEDPNQDRATELAFTPDGAKLLSATGDGFCVHVWDLQLIRRQLAEMGLDWK